MTAVDALLLWARSTAGRLAELVRKMTDAERLLTGLLLAQVIGGLAVGLVTHSKSAWSVAGVAGPALWFLLPVLADAVVLRSRLRRTEVELMQAQEVALTANLSKPTGAPRVAEVPCSHGVVQRFIYGPGGWTPAGPAPTPGLPTSPS